MASSVSGGLRWPIASSNGAAGLLFLLFLVGCGGGNNGGSAVPIPPSIHIDLQVSPQTIHPGESVSISWTTANADSCIATGDWSGAKPLSGHEIVGPINVDRTFATFALDCSSNGNPAASSSVGINVWPDTPLPTTYTYRRSSNAVNDAVWDPRQRLMYLAIGSTGVVYPNSVIAFDPVSGVVVTSAFAGSEPSSLALSDDGQFLYVGLSGSDTLARFKLPALVLDASFPVDPDVRAASPSEEPYFARQLAVAPGAPYTVAVVRTNPQISGGETGALVFDNQSPKTNAFRLGYYERQLVWAPTSDYLFGIDDLQQEYGLDVFSVSTTGVSQVGSIGGLSRTLPDALHIGGGLIFNDGGSIFDPRTQQIIGSFPTSGLMAPDTENGKAFFATPDSVTGGVKISSYDLGAHAKIAEALLSGNTGGVVEGQPTHMIRWGDNGLAITTTLGQLVVLWGDFVAPAIGSNTVPVGAIPGTAAADDGSWLQVSSEATRFPLGAVDIAWDVVRNRIYASIPDGAASNPRSIAVIDPTSGTVVSYLRTASSPGPLSVSSDSQYLYVGQDHSFQRFNLSNLSDVLAVNIDWGTPVSIAAAPGAPRTAAVGFRGATSIIFDDGVPRTDPFHGGSPFWGDNVSVLFTLDNESTAFGLYRYAVSSSGVSETDYVNRKFSSVVTDPFYFRAQHFGGRVIAETGAIYDLASRGVAGSLSLGPVVEGERGLCALTIDRQHRRVYAAITSEHQLSPPFPDSLVAFDLDTFVPIARTMLPSEVVNWPRELLQISATAYAVLADDGALVLVNSAGLAP